MRYALVAAGAVLLAVGASLAVRQTSHPKPQTPPAGARTSESDLVAKLAAEAAARARKRYQDLLRQFEAASEEVATRPGDPEAHVRLGDVQLRLGRVQDARKSFDEALRLGPTSTGALYGIAGCSLGEGDYEGALKAYREIARLHPDEPGLAWRIRAVISTAQRAAQTP